MFIGNVEIQNNCILAPMAGVTDLAYRRLCKEMGCGMLYTEMVSAKAILYHNRNTEELLRTVPQERPIAVQLFGSEPEIMAEAAKFLEERPFDIIDINMGCPVPKIVNNGEGSALMKNPVLAGKIVEAVAGAVHKPVTVKMRKGFYDGQPNAPEFAYVVQESGGAAVAVHGRTREQYYAGRADWEIIRQVKERVHIPVIGNGDVMSAQDALNMLRQTDCDAVMVGRAARGNPWIFREITMSLDSGTAADILQLRPSKEELRRMILRHAQLLLADKGEYIGIHQMRKHVAWYTAGMPNATKLRRAVNGMETFQELEDGINELFG